MTEERDLSKAKLTLEEFQKKINEMVSEQIAFDDGDGARIASVVSTLTSELGTTISIIGGGQPQQIEQIAENTKKFMLSEAIRFAPKAYIARLALHALKKSKEKREKMN